MSTSLIFLRLYKLLQFWCCQNSYMYLSIYKLLVIVQHMVHVSFLTGPQVAYYTKPDDIMSSYIVLLKPKCDIESVFLDHSSRFMSAIMECSGVIESGVKVWCTEEYMFTCLLKVTLSPERYSFSWKLLFLLKDTLSPERYTVSWKILSPSWKLFFLLKVLLKDTFSPESYSFSWKIHCLLKVTLSPERYTVSWKILFLLPESYSFSWKFSWKILFLLKVTLSPVS